MYDGFIGLTPDELEEWKPVQKEYIISRNVLISQGTLGIYGAEGRFKSMLAMDLMYRIAEGKSWFGFDTKPSSAYYFQSEIPQQPLQVRSRKYREGNDVVAKDCWLATDLYEKVDKGWGASYMENELDRTRPQVLIIDPLYNSTSIKLTDDFEVGTLLDKFNQWRKMYQCSMVLIHHNRQEEHKEGESYHYGTDEWFGSSRFKRWLDTIIYVELVNDADPIVDLRLTFEKVRHAESKILPIDIQVNRNNLVFDVRM